MSDDRWRQACEDAWQSVHRTTVLRRLERPHAVALGELAAVGESYTGRALGQLGDELTAPTAARIVARRLVAELDELADLAPGAELTLDELEALHLAVAALGLAVDRAVQGAADRAWRARQMVLVSMVEKAKGPGVSPTPAPPHGSGAAGGMVERRQKLGTCSCGELVTMTADASGEGWRYRCPRCDRFGAFAR